MKATILALLVLCLAAATASGQYHHPTYLFGGYYDEMNANTMLTGVNLLDATGSTPVVTRLVQPGYTCHSIRMDYDNAGIIFGVDGTTSGSSKYGPMRNGLFRYDPGTMLVHTIYRYRPDTITYHAVFDAVVDQDGDYLAGVRIVDNRPSRNEFELWHIDRTGRVTTVLTRVELGWPPYFAGKMVRDIDTGRILFSDHGGIYGFDTSSRTFATWNSIGGWVSTYAMPQNHRTAAIEGAYGSKVLRQPRGKWGLTTLHTLPYPCWLQCGGRFDLQTAASVRQVYVGVGPGGTGAAIYHLDATTWAVTTVIAHAKYGYSVAGLEFYRGRHTQSVKTGTRRWEIRLSAPQFPGKGYAVAAGLSGARPGITLPDQRRIHLNIDPLVLMTLYNLLPGIWSGGAYSLDANGEARASLNLSGVPRLDAPLWIVWLILDPAAPGGIAYIPDTYVMRV